jgi:group I intron endonuclease
MHIYKWTHKETGKVYIGQSVQKPNRRRLEHISGARHTNKSYHFHNAIRVYGVEAFDWEVLDYADNVDHLNALEKKYIEEYNSIEEGYNIRQGGDNKLHSEDSKKRMSKAQKAAHARRRDNGGDGGWKRRDGGPMKGKAFSEDHKRKVGLANKGKMKGKTWKLVDGKRVWMEVV